MSNKGFSHFAYLFIHTVADGLDGKKDSVASRDHVTTVARELSQVDGCGMDGDGDGVIEKSSFAPYHQSDVTNPTTKALTKDHVRSINMSDSPIVTLQELLDIYDQNH